MADDIILQDAEIQVWHQNTPDSTNPDTTIPASVLDKIEISSRAAEIADEVAIDIFDVEGTPSELRMGDRIETSIEISDGTGYGMGGFGEGLYGGGGTISWTGRVLAPSHTKDHEGILGSSLSTDATDYIAGILTERQVTGEWTDEDVGSIIRDICERKASEIDASNVPDLGVTTDLFAQNSDCWDTIVGLAARADALITQSGLELRVDPITGLTHAFDLTTDDYLHPFETNTDDDVKNIVRVDSGVSRQEEASQTTQSSFTRVTESSRFTFQLRARKSAIHSVDLFVDSASDEDLILRLQADEGGSPVAVNDEDSDIDSTQWSSDNLPDGDWKAFFFNSHTLPDRDPWLIIETSGSTGHDVGVDGSGNLTYRSYYPHPINFEVSSPDSIAEYGSREIQIERDNLETLSAARDAAEAELARRAWPSKTISFTADSPRTHLLEPGDEIGVNNPDQNAVGDFIVTEAKHDFDAEEVRLQTEISATWRKGILEPQS